MLDYPVETIIFDLDGTLRHNTPSAEETQLSYLTDLGIHIPSHQQKRGTRWIHYYWAQSPELSSDLKEFGDINDRFWVRYAYRYLQTMKIDEYEVKDVAQLLSQHMVENFTPEDQVYPCVEGTLTTLKKAGYNMGLVSNRSNPCQEYCSAIGLSDYFHFMYVAAEVNAWKPDPRIFERALSLTGSKPNHTVYIGDNYYADVIGAMNAGIQPILLDPKSIFFDAECTVIHKIEDLSELL